MARRLFTRDAARGQALAEAAIVAPLFFAILFGIIDLGRVVWANDVVANAAREAARYASVNAGTVGINLELTAEATKDQIRERAEQFVVAGGMNTRVTVCFSAVHVSTGQQGCTGDTDEDIGGQPAAYARGNLVTVTVWSDVPIFASAVIGGTPITVRGESTVLINN
jgi:Flp pilus assembly protein TadG